MAKQQTFGDKLKKRKQQDLGIHVKVVRAMKSDTGSMRFTEKFVKVNDISEIDQIDFTKIS